MPRATRVAGVLTAVALVLLVSCFAIGIILGRNLDEKRSDWQSTGGRDYNRAAHFRFAEESVSVPIHLAGNQPLVDVLVNEKGPFLFLLDTGAPESSLALDLCKSLDLPELETRWYNYDTVDSRVEQRTFGIDSLRLGDAEVIDAWAEAFDATPLRKAMGVELAGILGVAHFLDHSMTIDCVTQQLSLERLGTQEKQAEDLVPMTVRRRRLLIPLHLGDHEYSFMLDTGMTGCLAVPQETALSLSLHEEPTATGKSVGAAATVRHEMARLAVPVRLGPHEIHNADVRWFVDVPGKLLLGCGMLEYFVVELDFPAGTARFSRNKQGPIVIPKKPRLPKILRMNSNGSALNLDVRIDEEAGLVRSVTAVSSSGELQSAFQEGDIIESINGIPTKERTRKEVEALLQGAVDRATVTLKVRRNGEVRKLTFHQGRGSDTGDRP